MIAGVVDNGICADDPRVLTRLNEATKMTLDLLCPVGGMATYNVTAAPASTEGRNKIVELYPVPDPPPSGNPVVGRQFKMILKNADLSLILADVTYTVIAGDTYPSVIGELTEALRSALEAQDFIVTSIPSWIRLEHGSDFAVTTWAQITLANETVTVGGLVNPDEVVTGDDNNPVTTGDSSIQLSNKQVVVQSYVVPVEQSFLPSGVGPFLMLPPQLENCIEAVVLSGRVRGQEDIREGWYEIVNNSVYLDPAAAHDNPLIDRGLWPDPVDPGILRRVYEYPGLTPSDAIVQVTGAKRFIPIKTDDDYLIVQNIEGLKMLILSIERSENAAPDEAAKYLKMGLDLFQAETKKHILDPRNYMRRKAAYYDDLVNFPENTLGWMRASIAIDVVDALKTGKIDLTWSINQVERRIMQRGIFKDCVITMNTNVVGGFVYFPLHVGGVLAVDLGGRPIPIRSEFFQFLENGPGQFPCHEMLIDQGDEYFPGTRTTRRKYKLIADCDEGQCLTAVCRLRWLMKKATDLMVIKNYEAIRLMMTAKFLEEGEKWNEALMNQKQAIDLLERELGAYLSGILHTVHVQTVGFGMADVGGYWGH